MAPTGVLTNGPAQAHRLGQHHRHALRACGQRDYAGATQDLLHLIRTDGLAHLQAFGRRSGEVGNGSDHQTPGPWASLCHETPCVRHDVGALAQADLTGEHDQLVGSVDRRWGFVAHEDRIAHQLGSHSSSVASHEVERLLIQTGDAIGATARTATQTADACRQTL